MATQEEDLDYLIRYSAALASVLSDVSKLKEENARLRTRSTGGVGVFAVQPDTVKILLENAELKRRLQECRGERAAYQDDMEERLDGIYAQKAQLLRNLTESQDRFTTLFAENENLKKDVKRVNKSRDAFCDVYDRLLTENIALKAKAQTP